MILTPGSKRSLLIFSITVGWVASELLLFYSDTASVLGVKPKYYLVIILLFFCTIYTPRTLSRRRIELPNISRTTIILFGVLAFFVANALFVSALNHRPLSFSSAVILLFWPIIVFFTSLAVAALYPLHLIYALVFVTSVSAIISLFQALDIEFAWELRRLLADDIPRGWRLYNRNPGLAQQSVRAAEILLLGLCIALAFLLYHKSKIFWLFIATVHLFAIYASGTRSAIFAAVLALSFTYIKQNPSKTKFRLGAVILVALLLSIGFFTMSNHMESRILSLQDYSAQLRVLFNSIGAEMAAEWPWGYGAQSFSEISYIFFLDGTMTIGENDFRIGLLESHNYFLNILVYYGAQGLAACLFILFLFWKIGKNLLLSRNRPDQFIGFILVFSIMTQSIDSFFHNSGIMNGFSGLFLLFGTAFTYRRRKYYQSSLLAQSGADDVTATQRH
jgi:O-antigen ligase